MHKPGSFRNSLKGPYIDALHIIDIALLRHCKPQKTQPLPDCSLSFNGYKVNNKAMSKTRYVCTDL